MELEQYTDLTPVKAEDSSGAKTWTLRSVLTSEFEYGITDRLELGVYLQLSNDTGSATVPLPFTLDGVKQRLRYRFAAPGQWPVDLALYLEFAELNNEFELEGKVNLERRLGPVAFMVNLWAESESYYNGINEWVINPTGGVTWQIHPIFHLGLEFWMHAEFGQSTTNPVASFNSAPHYYAGPAVLLEFGRFWWSNGAYLRFDGINDPLPDRPGVLYGHVWVRTMLGVEL